VDIGRTAKATTNAAAENSLKRRPFMIQPLRGALS
jgi:hypothetical protein